MKQRSVVIVMLLLLFTCGIYMLIWHVKTKREMNECGADIPTAWWLLVPFANIWWIYRWCGGVEHVTREKMNQPVAFILHACLPLIGYAIIQDAFNKAVRAGVPAALPAARAL